MEDRLILRELAKKYAECAFNPINAHNIKLHSAVNDLHQIRPIFFIEELPWHEMNFDHSLDLECVEPRNRAMEICFKKALFRWKYMPSDTALLPYIRVQKKVSGMNSGIEIKQEKLSTDENNNVVAHHYISQIETEDDLEKLKFSDIKYLEKETMEEWEYFDKMFGDIIPVKIVGHASGYGNGAGMWDIIPTLVGVNEMMYKLIDEPEFMHKLVRKLTDIFLEKVRQMNELGLFDPDALYCHTSPTSSDELKKVPFTDGKPTSKNVWGRGFAQIFTSVSADMHDEFDIQYMMEAMEPFGLVYYGCCEALDTKIDIVRKIPNLRKISMSPWANIENGCEKIGKDFVVSAKPNPSIFSENFDLGLARKEIQLMLDSAQKNNCALEMIMKDISTINYKPENVFKWCELVSSMLK